MTDGPPTGYAALNGTPDNPDSAFVFAGPAGPAIVGTIQACRVVAGKAQPHCPVKAAQHRSTRS